MLDNIGGRHQPSAIIIPAPAEARGNKSGLNDSSVSVTVHMGTRARGDTGADGNTGTGKPMTTHYRSFSKTNLESTLSALLVVTGWPLSALSGYNGKSFS